MPKIERVTMFKIPNASDRAKLVEHYKVMSETAVKVRYQILHKFSR